jgi:geranylgeranyl pyrophosphate synthase
MACRQTVELATDRCTINQYLKDLLCSPNGEPVGPVQEAMQYAVLGSGQRIRPILSIRIARLFGGPVAATLRAAAAVELFHCASLVVDDLPCMDDSPSRRDRDAVHIRFGESTALLAAFGLVALAARSVVEESAPGPCRDRLVTFQVALLRSLDCSGLLAGQAMDLQMASSGNSHLRTGTAVSDLKTVPLFNLAVMAGALFADPDADAKVMLSGFGREFGLAFQMSDDLLDGEEENSAFFKEKLSLLRAATAHFGDAGQDLEALVDYLHDRVADHKTC